MENLVSKADFLQNRYIGVLNGLSEDAPRKWGKMNVRQMIEHMSDYVRIANGRTLLSILTPEDRLEKLRGFLMSEKPMPENTTNALMPETPAPVKHADKQSAIEELKKELSHFFEVHQNEQGRTTANPFFGMLDYDMQVQLLYKHATHHLRQFGVEDFN